MGFDVRFQIQLNGASNHCTHYEHFHLTNEQKKVLFNGSNKQN